LTPPPVKVLLLLHSAVVRDEPAELWLAWLRNDAGRALLGQLEMSHDPADRSGADGAPSPSALAKATLLLGLADVTPPEQPVPSPGLQPPLPPNFGGIEGGGRGRGWGPNCSPGSPPTPGWPTGSLVSTRWRGPGTYPSGGRRGCSGPGRRSAHAGAPVRFPH
jgi:hypothetical protein